jgi:hypothetical protein
MGGVLSAAAQVIISSNRTPFRDRKQTMADRVFIRFCKKSGFSGLSIFAARQAGLGSSASRAVAHPVTHENGTLPPRPFHHDSWS